MRGEVTGKVVDVVSSLPSIQRGTMVEWESEVPFGAPLVVMVQMVGCNGSQNWLI